MMCTAAILACATKPIGWSFIAGLLITALAALYLLLLWFSPSRGKAMAAMASEMGLQFFPKLSADQMGTLGASFVYAGIAGARNCMRGTIKGRETVIFDQRMWDPVTGSGEPFEIRVVGFRVAADSFCRDRGVVQRTFWHVEKMGEWVFVYHARPPVQSAEITSYVEEARARFETATNPKGHQPPRLPDPIS
jgi:hypothetical protein